MNGCFCVVRHFVNGVVFERAAINVHFGLFADDRHGAAHFYGVGNHVVFLERSLVANFFVVHDGYVVVNVNDGLLRQEEHTAHDIDGGLVFVTVNGQQVRFFGERAQCEGDLFFR